MVEENDREVGRGGARLLRRVLFAVAPVVAVSLLGQLATTPNIPTWYAGLDKPGFTPPNWVFAPVWTSLYLLMAVAAWRLLAAPAGTPGRKLAVWLFYVQLAFNLAWSWMFFAAQSPLLGAINIVPQWILIVGAIAASWRVDRFAAACLAPLAAWVAYAAALNFGVLILNA
ncbi:MAG: tryptophan-rich sensory protein [Maricaulaceae bacterium]|jgi:tryptophan-rich sensory protein